MSPTQRSLEELRERGYACWIVEYYNSFSRHRVDLFGCIDILAIKEGLTLAVQTTSRGHTSDRAKKIKGNEYYKIMKSAGWEIEVHGWGKVIVGKYKNGKNKLGYKNKTIKL